MKRYTVVQLRNRLADALDEAERGAAVVIERRGVRYVLRAERTPRRRRTRRSVIETLDPAVAQGQWEWAWTPEGLRPRGRRRGR